MTLANAQRLINTSSYWSLPSGIPFSVFKSTKRLAPKKTQTIRLLICVAGDSIAFLFFGSPVDLPLEPKTYQRSLVLTMQIRQKGKTSERLGAGQRNSEVHACIGRNPLREKRLLLMSATYSLRMGRIARTSAAPS